MKRILMSIMFVSFIGWAYGQYPLEVGGKQLNAGFGFSTWGLPVYVGADFGVHKDISIGPEISFRSYRENWGGYVYSNTILGFSFNGNYHFNSLMKIPNSFDFYAGLNLGFFVWNTDDGYGGSGASGLGFGGQVGGRYYFNDKWGINLELGGGNSFSGGKIGVTFKF